MCEALNRAGQYAEALAMCRRASDIWTKEAASNVIISYARTGIGLALLGLGRPAEAIAPLEDAVATRTEARVGDAVLSESRFALARALWFRAPDRPRALALARQARTEAGADSHAVAAIDAWLSEPARRVAPAAR
jgi:hypothetical protein